MPTLEYYPSNISVSSRYHGFFLLVLLAFLYPIPHFTSKFGSFGPKLKYNCETNEVSVCVYALF